MAELFDLGDLASFLQVPEVDTETATRVRRVVSGWLQDATGLTVWPDPVPDRLWAWAVELAAIVYVNPDGAVEEQTDDHRVKYGERRTEILAAARAAYPPAGVAAAGPLWSFPQPDWSWESVSGERL